MGERKPLNTKRMSCDEATIKKGLRVTSGRKFRVTISQRYVLAVALCDGYGEPLGPCQASVELPDGSSLQLSVDAQGHLTHEDITQSGVCQLQLDLPGRPKLGVHVVSSAEQRIPVRVPRQRPA